jgi:hypothetical protein
MVGKDGLPTNKRVVAWFPGSMEDMKCYFQQLCRLNQGTETGHWRVYEHRGELNGVHPVLHIDTPSVAALRKMGWQPFVMEEAIFSLLGAKPEGKM